MDIEDLSKTIVDEFSFQNGRVTEYSTDVVFGHAPARLGNPPLVQINLFDFRGNLVEQFNGWHPLWTFVRDDLDLEHLIIDTEATGSIAFPFSSAYGVMRVVDVERVQEIFSVDLLVPIRNFCNDRLEDPDCRNIADFDGDGDVDQNDLDVLLRDLNRSVADSTCGAPCDLDVDGIITALDARKVALRCTRPGCATE